MRIPGSGKYLALLIPDRALAADQAQKFVYVVNAEKKVEFRPVKVGPMIDGLRVVKEGLKAGEQVIAEGLMRVRPALCGGRETCGDENELLPLFIRRPILQRSSLS